MYEVRVFRGTQEVTGAGTPFTTALDLEAALSTHDLLARHLYAAVARAGGKPQVEAHLYHLEIRATDSQGRGRGNTLFRFALPVDPQVFRAEWTR
jgi:hypothetical protein